MGACRHTQTERQTHTHTHTHIHKNTHTHTHTHKGKRLSRGSFCSRRYKFLISRNATPSFQALVSWLCPVSPDHAPPTPPCFTQLIYLTQWRASGSDRQISPVPKAPIWLYCRPPPPFSLLCVCTGVFTMIEGALQPSLSETWWVNCPIARFCQWASNGRSLQVWSWLNAKWKTEGRECIKLSQSSK